METFKFLLFLLGVAVAFYTFRKPKPKPRLSEPSAAEEAKPTDPKE